MSAENIRETGNRENAEKRDVILSVRNLEKHFNEGQLKALRGITTDILRGEVVCVRLPEGGTVLRRVVAVSGDTVEVRGGAVYINGLAERGNYSFTRPEAAADGPRYPLLLRQGEFFVLADRREILADSRSFGLLTEKDILGKVLIQ